MHYSNTTCGILIIFYENYACLRILLRGIFILVLISESRGGVCRWKCFVATLHSTVFESWKVWVNQNFTKDHFHLRFIGESHGGDWPERSILCNHVAFSCNCCSLMYKVVYRFLHSIIFKQDFDIGKVYKLSE